MFAASFLQIPLRSGHPCSWLMIRTATLIRDFHPIVITHAGRTQGDTGRSPAPVLIVSRIELPQVLTCGGMNMNYIGFSQIK